MACELPPARLGPSQRRFVTPSVTTGRTLRLVQLDAASAVALRLAFAAHSLASCEIRAVVQVDCATIVGIRVLALETVLRTAIPTRATAPSTTDSEPRGDGDNQRHGVVPSLLFIAPAARIHGGCENRTCARRVTGLEHLSRVSNCGQRNRGIYKLEESSLAFDD